MTRHVLELTHEEDHFFSQIEFEDIFVEPFVGSSAVSPSVVSAASNPDYCQSTSANGKIDSRHSMAKTPLEQFRPRHFFVSDFVAHTWCPQKAFLSARNPHFEEDMEEICSRIDSKFQPVIKIGTIIHEKRERELHATKIVKTCTPEDRFAVRLLKTYILLHELLQGKPVEREIPVFGMPLDLGVVIFGIIDEVRLDLNRGILTLSETKTRNVRREPGTAQKIGHDLQIMLYKCLFEDFIQNKIPWNLILNIERLNKKAKFSDTVLREIVNAGLTCENLEDFHPQIMAMTSALPKDILLNVEYLHQSSGETFLVNLVEYNEDWLREQMGSFLDAWTARKPILGASVHEAWKCGGCYFANMCEWRLARISNHCPDAGAF